MNFLKFRNDMQEHLMRNIYPQERLFLTDTDSDYMWELYLLSFPAGTNNIYREKTEHDCSCCRHFIKSFGSVVAIVEGKIVTIWDFKTAEPEYQQVIDVLAEYVKSKAIKDYFVTKENSYGTDKNNELKYNVVNTYYHFYTKIPKKFVYDGGSSIAEITGEYRTIKEVFQSSLEKISLEAVDIVIELINQNSLYKGNEWLQALRSFRNYKLEYTNTEYKNIWVWNKAMQAGSLIGKIKNHSIGMLLTDISDGMNIDSAVTRYEKIVAPTNYKRPKAIFTQKMLDDTKKELDKLGFLESLNRRFAKIEDINASQILFADRNTPIGNDIFSQIIPTVTKPKSFGKVEEIQLDDFINNVLPTTEKLELLLENRLTKNLCSLITGEGKSMFKWNNNFSWAYTGNITDSFKNEVEKAGGNTNAVLRFSIMWNEDKSSNQDDYDAHCIVPTGNEIYFSNKNDTIYNGFLDVDIIHPNDEIGIENICFLSKEKLRVGTYRFFVNNFTNRGGKTGFKAEIEFNGEIYSYEYPYELKHKEAILVADIYYDGNKITFQKEYLKQSGTTSKEIWKLQSNDFIPVTVVVNSPNYWNTEIGNKHTFFMLKDCINPECPNGFYNEFLIQELDKHKRVMELLGNKLHVEKAENQLSGLGFSSTIREEFTVRVTSNSMERLLKIKV